jgi:hypothetical protein
MFSKQQKNEEQIIKNVYFICQHGVYFLFFAMKHIFMSPSLNLLI